MNTKPQPLRAAIYNRVSTDKQDAQAGVLELRDVVRSRGWRSVLEVPEVVSGARANRPGLLRVLAAAEAGEVDVVVVTALDRWGRSALDLHTHVERVLAAGCRFVAVRQGLDLQPANESGGAVSHLILGVLAAVAEFEREIIRERTRAGLAAARRRGARLGRPRLYATTRGDVLAARAAGGSWAQVARQLSCSPSAARRLAA